MPTFKVFGKIEPACYQISFDIEPRVQYRIDEADIDLDCQIYIEKSEILVMCETNRWDDATIGWALQYLFDWVSAEIDLFTFASGKVFNVHLDGAEYPDGIIHELVGEAPELAALATACNVTDAGDSVRVEILNPFLVIMGNPTSMIALRDLVSALRYGNNSLINCGRAIEGLRKSLWGKDEADNEETTRAWEHFRKTLRVSRPYLQAITDASRSPRHGSSSYISGSLREDILKKSWAVMNRFLQYRLGGDQPLTDKDYPIL